MKETITIDKKVLFDLISHVAMVAADAATGVMNKSVPEEFSFHMANQLPSDLNRHVEDVLSGYIRILYEQPEALKQIKTVTCHVSQAWHHDERADIKTAFDCIMKAVCEIPEAIRELHIYADMLHDIAAEDAENRAGDLWGI